MRFCCGCKFPKREIEEPIAEKLFGPVEEERSCVHGLPTYGLEGMTYITTTPILKVPDMDVDFLVCTNAS